MTNGVGPVGDEVADSAQPRIGVAATTVGRWDELRNLLGGKPPWGGGVSGLSLTRPDGVGCVV